MESQRVKLKVMTGMLFSLETIQTIQKFRLSDIKM